MLRLLNNKLATDDSLSRFGVQGPSKCFCCHNGMNDNINHLFCYGQIAEKVWKFFEHTLGLLWPNSDSIRTKLMRWWRIKSTNKVLELTTQCLPSVICWELWKHRCTYKYEGTKIYSGNIIHQATYHIHLILTSQFPSLKFPTKFQSICRMMENIKPKIDITPVLWSKPNYGEYKLNVDSCSKGNPGSASGGGILRNHMGHMIMAFTIYFGHSSNNLAEARAIKIGLKWCIDHCFNVLTIESDSLTVINIINKATTTIWSIKEESNDIHNMTSKGNFQFIHIFREENNTTDLLANYAELDRKNDFFTETFHLLRKIVATMKNDEEARPNFRIRLRKNTFIFDPG
ncbi:hypothetical protein KY284_029704 [Solanum tuberosum]|nr:hypothetical protein KY284_029704 [Solanum tuberosum]